MSCDFFTLTIFLTGAMGFVPSPDHDELLVLLVNSRGEERHAVRSLEHHPQLLFDCDGLGRCNSAIELFGLDVRIRVPDGNGGYGSIRPPLRWECDSESDCESEKCSELPYECSTFRNLVVPVEGVSSEHRFVDPRLVGRSIPLLEAQEKVGARMLLAGGFVQAFDTGFYSEWVFRKKRFLDFVFRPKVVYRREPASGAKVTVERIPGDHFLVQFVDHRTEALERASLEARVSADDSCMATVWLVNQPTIRGWREKLCGKKFSPHFQSIYKLSGAAVDRRLPIPFNSGLKEHCDNLDTKVESVRESARARGRSDIGSPIGTGAIICIPAVYAETGIGVEP